ncbi:hypothetical protein D3C72_1790060 [compost metagenome]
MFPKTTIFQCCFCPIKLKLVRQFDLMNASVVLILKRSVFDQPLESFQVSRIFAGLKDHVKIVFRTSKLGKDRVAIVFI